MPYIALLLGSNLGDAKRMTNDMRRYLEIVLRDDERPWRTMPEWLDSELVDFEFPVIESTAGHEVASLARELGFSVISRPTESLNKSVGNEVHQLLNVVIHYGPTIYTVYKGAKELADLPASIRKFREGVRSYFPRAERLAPPLNLPVVESWLTRKYGTGKWRVDPTKVEGKPIHSVTVFVVKEEKSGTTHLLAVDGDECEEVPAAWMPPLENQD